MERFPHSHVRFIIFSGKEKTPLHVASFGSKPRISSKRRKVSSHRLRFEPSIDLMPFLWYISRWPSTAHTSDTPTFLAENGPMREQRRLRRRPTKSFGKARYTGSGLWHASCRKSTITPLFKEWFLSRDSVKNADEWGV